MNTVVQKEQEYNPTLERWASDPEDQEIFHRFVKEWEDWHETYEEPKSADQELRNSMDLHESRLKQRGIQKSMRLELLDEKPVNGGKVIPLFKSRRSMNYVDAKQTNTYKRLSNGKVLYKNKQFGTLYETIIHGEEDGLGQDALYNCPNCGNVAKINDLLDGCPYCNTHFVMGDLFPKVFKANFMRDTTGRYTLKRDIILFQIVMGIGAFIYALTFGRSGFFDGDIYTTGRLIYVLFFSAFFGFVEGYIMWAMSKFFYGLFLSLFLIPALFGTIGSKHRAKVAIRLIDPSLNVDYLESKTIALIRSIIFAEDESQLVQYRGPKLEESFKEIVDMSDAGTLGVNRYRRVVTNDGEEAIELDVSLYVEVLFDKGEKLSRKKKVLQATISHKIGSGINPMFTISRIQCKSCGGSFDAYKQKKCPYCGTTYDVESDDFVVTSLSMK